MNSPTTTGAAAAPVIEATTTHEPLPGSFAGLFAVQAGVPLGAAMDSLEALLCTASDTAWLCATSGASASDMKGALWAVEHLLSMAVAAHRSIHGGYVQHKKRLSA